MPDPAKSLASAISNAQKRFAEETGNIVTKTVKKYEMDENGKRVKDEDGKSVVIGEDQVEVPETRLTRQFVAKAAKGGAYVFRTA